MLKINIFLQHLLFSLFPAFFVAIPACCNYFDGPEQLFPHNFNSLPQSLFGDEFTSPAARYGGGRHVNYNNNYNNDYGHNRQYRHGRAEYHSEPYEFFGDPPTRRYSRIFHHNEKPQPAYNFRQDRVDHINANEGHTYDKNNNDGGYGKTTVVVYDKKPADWDELVNSAASYKQPEPQVSTPAPPENHKQVQTILDLKFAKDFDKFNPRNPSSLFEFTTIDNITDLAQDNAAFLRGTYGIIDMVSVPFAHWLPQSGFGLAPALAVYDANARLKQSITVASNQVLKVSYKFKCRTFNVELNKFPKGAVKRANDDPRLAACRMAVVDVEKTGLAFGIFATNKGVWAKYSRDLYTRALLNSTYNNYNAFDVYRRIGSRKTFNELIDVRIEVDRHRQQTRYYLDNHLVWTIKEWGILSKGVLRNTRNRLVLFSASRKSDKQYVRHEPNDPEPERFTIFIANGHKLDEADPNKDAEYGDYSRALVRLVDLPNFYGHGAEFYDEESKRDSSLWGQGATTGLHSLLAEIEGEKKREKFDESDWQNEGDSHEGKKYKRNFDDNSAAAHPSKIKDGDDKTDDRDSDNDKKHDDNERGGDKKNNDDERRFKYAPDSSDENTVNASHKQRDSEESSDERVEAADIDQNKKIHDILKDYDEQPWQRTLSKQFILNLQNKTTEALPARILKDFDKLKYNVTNSTVHSKTVQLQRIFQ